MTPLDTLLFLWINATPATPVWLLALARWVSTDLPALVILALVPLVLFGPAARRQVLGVCLAMVLAWLAVRGIRETVHVARPFELGLGRQWLAHAATAGFPSFHAAVAGAWAGGLAMFAPHRPRLWLSLAGGVALAIAWSRVFLGLHFVSDIAVGLAVGAACAVTARQGVGWRARRRSVADRAASGFDRPSPLRGKGADTNRHKTGGTAALQQGVSQQTTHVQRQNKKGTSMPCRTLMVTLTSAAALLAPALSQAQVTLKPDGQWRYLLTAGANVSSGNNNAGTLNLSAEGANQTDYDKWTWNARADYGRNNGVDTTERYGLRTQYNRDFSTDWFGFGSGETLRDKLANIAARYSVASGVGRHIWAEERGYFDVSVGLGYTHDRYVRSTDIAGEMRDRYGRLELVLAEESSHKLTETTSLRQKFALYPNLRDSGKYRAVLDTGLTVAMTQAINLSAGLSYRYDSDPGTGLKNGDAMFVTGVSVRLD